MNVQEALKSYEERGFNVIPIVKGTKIPPKGLDLDKYFTDKYPVQELDSYISGGTNLGIIAGKTSGICIIDIDALDKKDFYLSQFPTELIAKTPSGGLHLFYQYKENLPEILKIPGGDFFAGKHYVVAAPSVFKDKDFTGYYEWLKFGNPGILSNKLFENQTDFTHGKYTRTQIFELINEALVSGLREGFWNDTLLYGSMVLAGDGWNQEAVTKLMMSLNKGKEPIPERQVLGIISRALEYARKNVKKEEVVKSTSIPFKILSYGEMTQKYSNYETKWLVESWILESAVIICSALPERFKTWVSVDLALSVVSGLPFLDNYEVCKTGNVLIVQQEDFGPRFLSRFKTVERSKLARAKIPVTIEETEDGFAYTSSYDISNKLFFHEDAELSLDNELSLQKLEERIKETNAVLCIIDPFYSLSDGKDFFASAAEKIRDRIKSIRRETGCAFLFIHHDRKSGNSSGNEGAGRESIYGSTFLNAAMEGAWRMGRNKGMGNTEIITYRNFKDMNAPAPTKIKFNINMAARDDNEAYFLEVEDMQEDLVGNIKSYLIDNGPCKFTELFEAFGDKFSSKTAFTTFLKKQNEKGIVQDGSRGKYSIAPDAD